MEQALTALGKVVLWCLSVAGDDARLSREMGRIGAALDKVLRAPNGLAALEVILRYIAATHAGMSVKNVGELLEKATGPRGQETIVTFIDEIEERGLRKGLAQGRAKGRAKALLDQLAARFGRVPANVSARIMATDEATLARWGLRVLTAPTMDDVLDESRGHAPPAKRARTPKRARQA